MIIVLVKVEMTALEPTGRLRFDGANYFPVYQPAPEAKACVWLSDGKPRDIAKAKAFADTEGYTVFTYENEKDPLGRARAEALKCHAK